MSEPSPFNSVPPLVVAIVVGAALIEATFALGQAGLVGGPRAVGWRLDALTDYAFAPNVLDWMLTRGDYAWDLTRRFVTYPFIHDSTLGALVGLAFLLALGKFVGEVFAPLNTAILLFVTTVTGALVFGLFAPPSEPLYGLFPPVFGLIGAYTYLLWRHLAATGGQQAQAFRLIGVLLAIQLIFAALFGTSSAWIAEVAAFVTGFAASILLAPGGWAAFRMWMRQRR